MQSLERKNLKVFMPNLLNKKDKFDALEANQSRSVTILRWVVESVNGRLKNMFKYFDQVIPMKSLPTLNRLLLIALSIINAFSPPIFNENNFHNEIIKNILARVDKKNDLQEEVASFDTKTKWQKVDENSAKDFPRLTMDELRLLTLGVYQLNMAKLYNNQHSYYGT